MSVVETRLRPTAGLPGFRAAAGWALGAVALFGFATALARVLEGFELPLKLALVAGAGLVGLLVFALWSYDGVVTLGMLLFGVALWQPAPPDIVLSIAIAVAAVTGRFVLDRVPASIVGLIGFFLALNLLAAIYAVDPIRAGSFFMITVYLLTFSLWLTGYVSSPKRAAIVVRTLLATALLTCGIGLLSVFRPSIPSADLFNSGGRANGLFHDPNILGPFLVVPALIVLDELLEPRLLRLRPTFKLAALVMLVMGIVFAYSRAAWLNFAIGLFMMLVVWLLRRGGSRKVARLLLVFVAAIGIATVALAASGSVQFLQERARLQTYDTNRFNGQEAGVRLAQDYPMGIGPGQFEGVVGIAAHSTYVRALTEEGVLGLVTLLAILLVTLTLALRNVVEGRSTYGIGSAALLAAWCGVMANSAFVDTLHWRHTWLVAALIWAGVAARPTAAPVGRFASG